MRDPNARVGNDNIGYGKTMDLHGYGIQSDHGERLYEFCQHHGLVTAGALFPHKDIHKITRVPADGQTKSQLDHLLISGQWRSSVQIMDSWVQRGADVNRDLYLEGTGIKLRLSLYINKNKVEPKVNI